MDSALLSLAARLLRADPRQGGLLSIALLREAAGLPADEFNAALLELIAARDVDLYPHDYPASLTPEDSAGCFHSGDRVYNALSLRSVANWQRVAAR